MTKAAISAVYVDYKRIKTRKVHQIVLEVPSENWAKVYAVLGEPDIDSSDWFALAKLEGVPSEKLKGGEISRIAGMLCNEGGFQTYCQEVHSSSDPRMVVLDYCDITSRAHLDHNEDAAKAFSDLRSSYETWRRVA